MGRRQRKPARSFRLHSMRRGHRKRHSTNRYDRFPRPAEPFTRRDTGNYCTVANRCPQCFFDKRARSHRVSPLPTDQTGCAESGNHGLNYSVLDEAANSVGFVGAGIVVTYPRQGTDLISSFYLVSRQLPSSLPKPSRPLLSPCCQTQ